ncbi:Os02g0173400 [Oryza sativa Japonica Group]|uniref:Os02g0173400 protein n=1 Tax=Oryza sativa subsp. japonica TaxID=39947 RepID=Q0E3I5_ORYSJ|nr:Os02g0173400 [Oryza sativa Japonica Group]|eukprot:NP_001046039.1 Os02g0173400 [Oryza sativa Japonica Group]
MDEEEEKKKKNKQMDQEDGTKKMKLTKETKLPGTISAAETTKDIKLQTKKKEPIQIKGKNNKNYNFPGSRYLQDFEKGKKSETIESEIGENKAQLLYDQYIFLNENERLLDQFAKYETWR